MCATLCAVEAVATRRPQEFKHLVPSLISILKQVGCKSLYSYSHITVMLGRQKASTPAAPACNQAC